MANKKKGLEAKIVKHTHRKAFYGSVRDLGRKRFAMGHVYWYMFLRSGAGNMFELAEELMLADLGMEHSSLYSVLKHLKEVGWIKKHRPRDTRSGRMGVITWEVMSTVGKADSGEKSTVMFTNGGTPNVGTTNGGKPDTTVVLHSLYADAPTSSSTPSASTPPEGQSVSQPVSHEGSHEPSVAQDQEQEKPEEPIADEAEEELTPEVTTLRHEIGGDLWLPAMLGLPYFYATPEHNIALRSIAETLVLRNRSIDWLMDLVQWVKGVGKDKTREGKFWATRIHTGDRGLAQLAKHLETGEIVEQFDAHLAAQGKDLSPWGESRYLLRHAKATTVVATGRGFDPEEA